MIFTFIFVSLAFVALAGRIGWISVVASDTYAKQAAERQTKDVIIPAKRGAIFDRNMTGLAVSAPSFRIWIRPANLASGASAELGELNRAKAIGLLSDELGMDGDEILRLASQDKTLVRVAKDVGKETADRIRARVSEEGLMGVEIEESVSRYYPYGAFAAHVLGTVSDDGYGRGGIELEYDQYLLGIEGRWIKDTDRAGNSLAFGLEKRYEEQNGLNVVLTIDEAVQYYVEQAVDKVAEDTQAKRVMAIAMDPETGEVLAMCMTPDYDPNDPRTPLDPSAAEYVAALGPDEQLAYWNGMWRNPMVSDVYDPGSTFKLLTAAAALEEGVTSPNDAFRCSGYYSVGQNTLRCWRYYNPHGPESLTEAIGNSCNPVMIQLAQRMGFDRFYRYLELFGITGTTGIDYPGEGMPLVQSRETAGPVGLATMSFGQGISVTPIQMLTAICAIGNEGRLMQPRLVKALADDDGAIVESFAPKVVRQVVSEQTADEVKKIMEFVVEESGGSVVKTPGYRIGGKTGTAEKLYNGSYKTGRVTSSMIAMAPMDDPKVAVLLIVDEPQGVHYGSTTAGPGIKDMMPKILRHMNIQPEYTEAELVAMHSSYVAVPDLAGMDCSDAAGVLLGAGLAYAASPIGADSQDFQVAGQYPKAGTLLAPGGQVVLYSR
jgi:stage V sporulation protein D (sporulation-specific penicillin-binding protein)